MGERAYVIAEAGVNHEGNYRAAVEMIHVAAQSGCDAIKFQVYDPDQLATADAPAYWDTSLEPTATQRELFRKYARLTDGEHMALAAVARSVGLEFIVSVFHVEDVEWLAPIVDKFKIASADITNRPLLQAVRDTGKPVILSTGASDWDEILIAADVFHNANDLAVLHCTLSYPTAPEDVNLSAIAHLATIFNQEGELGYSDHTLPEHSIDACVGAYHCGARAFEKHFSLTPEAEGNDHYHSLDGAGFAELREALDFAAVLQGGGGKRVLECELPAREGARRSLVAAIDIREGVTFTEEMLCLKRPGIGIENQHLIIGRKAMRDIREDEVITADMVSGLEWAGALA